MVELSLTPLDVEKIKKVRFNDIPEVYEFEGNGIASLILPFVKNVLPKVLGTLGLAAATGAVSGAANKKASGRGIRRVGGAIKVTKKQLADMMEIANIIDSNSILNIKS